MQRLENIEQKLSDNYIANLIQLQVNQSLEDKLDLFNEPTSRLQGQVDKLTTFVKQLESDRI